MSDDYTPTPRQMQIIELMAQGLTYEAISRRLHIRADTTKTSVPQIAALPVADLAHPDGAHLYLWATNGFLFRRSTVCVWAKTPMGGGLGGAFGISTEFWIYARHGQLAPLTRVRGTWFNWKRPYDERGKPRHSAKPGEFFQLVETVSPGPRVELFARDARAGWDNWGDQAPDPIEWAS